ncbi:tetratricopeptide repeat protein [Microvirga sp. G4-2]|uniref:tetratricopeptide repeat protein n=1 Tax=Microvirga sp. G4-2 TaxID=3434467 RepID=UPI0040439F85
MRHLNKLILLMAVTLLTACQSVDGSGGGISAGGAVTEEPFVATDQPERVGREQFARGNYALAQRYFQNAVEAEPQNGDAWLGLAASYDQLGRFDLADRAYGQAVQIKGQTPQVLNNQGYSYLLRGDTARAERNFRKALALNPQNRTVSNNIALTKLAP